MVEGAQLFVEGAAGGQVVVGADRFDRAVGHDHRALANEIVAVLKRQDAVASDEDSAHWNLQSGKVERDSGHKI